ncbi:MAG: divalent-cation tolerance protein CutA [Bacillota bacterium]
MAAAYLVYITARDEQEARRIGRALVERRLAACANVVPRIASCYWWQGELVEDSEALLLVKTLEPALPALEQTVKSLHSYTVPAISAVPVERVHDPYLRWMREEMGAGPHEPGRSGGR